MLTQVERLCVKDYIPYFAIFSVDFGYDICEH